MREWLDGGGWPDAVEVAAAEPIAWVAPNAIAPGPRSQEASGIVFTLRVRRFVERGVVELTQDGRRLWRGRPRSGMLASFVPILPERLLQGAMVPGRPVHVPSDWVAAVRPGGGPIRMRIVE